MKTFWILLETFVIFWVFSPILRMLWVMFCRRFPAFVARLELFAPDTAVSNVDRLFEFLGNVAFISFLVVLSVPLDFFLRWIGRPPKDSPPVWLTGLSAAVLLVFLLLTIRESRKSQIRTPPQG